MSSGSGSSDSGLSSSFCRDASRVIALRLPRATGTARHTQQGRQQCTPQWCFSCKRYLQPCACLLHQSRHARRRRKDATFPHYVQCAAAQPHLVKNILFAACSGNHQLRNCRQLSIARSALPVHPAHYLTAPLALLMASVVAAPRTPAGSSAA
jgi:hypothetical protein